VISDVYRVAVAFRSGGLARFHLQAEYRRESTKKMTKGRHVFRVTRAEQAVNTAKYAHKDTVNNNDN
jgi:hypothetical protein